MTDKFWTFDFACLLFGFPLEQRCVRRPWLLAGKVVYRYASFTSVKNFLDFYLKPKSLTLKEKKKKKNPKNLKPKMLLGSETEVFLTIFTEPATYPWGSFGDAEARVSG